MSPLLARVTDLNSVQTAGLLALTGLAAVQAARLFWAVAAPLGPVGEPVAAAPPPVVAHSADLAVLARFDPFFRTASATTAPAPEAGAFRLYAVRSLGRGQGSAIIAGPDGRQMSIQTGEAAAPGVMLAAVAGDHVILQSNGRRSRLGFPSMSAGSPGSAYVPPPAPPPIQPVSAPAGFTFQPGAPGAEFLSAAGLQPGDIVTSVNGQGLTGAATSDALGLSTGQDATIQFERGGQARTATLRVP